MSYFYNNTHARCRIHTIIYYYIIIKYAREAPAATLYRYIHSTFNGTLCYSVFIEKVAWRAYTYKH